MQIQRGSKLRGISLTRDMPRDARLHVKKTYASPPLFLPWYRVAALTKLIFSYANYFRVVDAGRDGRCFRVISCFSRLFFRVDVEFHDDKERMSSRKRKLRCSSGVSRCRISGRFKIGRRA